MLGSNSSMTLDMQGKNWGATLALNMKRGFAATPEDLTHSCHHFFVIFAIQMTH